MAHQYRTEVIGSLLRPEYLKVARKRWEAGEIATITEERKLPHAVEPVETASEDSFPASDAPAWTGTTGP